jgi:hypothetical protein
VRCRLGRAVSAEPGAGTGNVLRGDDDDVTAGALEDEVTGDFAERQESTFDVHFFELAKSVEIYIFQICNKRDAGIDNQDINATPGSNDTFKASDHRFFVGDIDCNAHHTVTGYLPQVICETVKLIPWKIGCYQVTSLFQQAAANAVTDGSRGPGYQRNLIAERQMCGTVTAPVFNVKYPHVTKANDLGFAVAP